ncbi:MAG: hypothetical protein ABSG43_05350 [Solirubrobacteraceae bacterium]
METGATPPDVDGGAREAPPGCCERANVTTISDGHSALAYCECGARLAGDSPQELFAAAQRHLAHHHPQLLGAMGLDVVQQMADNVGGVTPLL